MTMATEPVMIGLSDRIDKIRYFINGPVRQHQLLKNTATWFQLCSCLDVLGDTELAINFTTANG